RLGEGARSTIYRVRDPDTPNQFYALKHVIRTDPKDIRFIEQMENEFEISRQFTHANLRRSYDLKISKSLLLKVNEAFLLMELVDGKPLDVRLPSDMMQIVDTFIGSLASSGASVSFEIASAFGATFSAICWPARVRLTSKRRPSAGSGLVSVRPRAVNRSITPLMVAPE